MTKQANGKLDQAAIDEFCQYLEQLIPKAKQLVVDASKLEKDDRRHSSLEDAMLYRCECDLFKDKVKFVTKIINRQISAGSKFLGISGKESVVTDNFRDAINTAMMLVQASEVRCATFQGLIYTLLYNDANIVCGYSRALKLIFKLYEIASEEECAKRKSWSKATKQRIATHRQV